MRTMNCSACGGSGIVVGTAGSTYNHGFGAWYPAESEEPCSDCHGTGEHCCVGCGGTPEIEDLGHGQVWCTACWLRERERPKSEPRLGHPADRAEDGCDLPF